MFTGESAVMGELLLDEGALNGYRNLHRNWLDTADTVDRIDVPTGFSSAKACGNIWQPRYAHSNLSRQRMPKLKQAMGTTDP